MIFVKGQKVECISGNKWAVSKGEVFTIKDAWREDGEDWVRLEESLKCYEAKSSVKYTRKNVQIN